MADGDISSAGEAASLAGEKADRFADAAMSAPGCPNCGSRGVCDCDPATATATATMIARKAVDEVLGPSGPGPFPPSSGLTRGGRAGGSMPVEHTEDGGR